MADAPKDKKDGGGGKGKDKGKDKPKDAPTKTGNEKLYQYSGEIIGLLLAVFFLAKLLNYAGEVITTRGYVSESARFNSILSSSLYFLGSFILFFTIFSNILSVLFLMGIIYSVIRLHEILADQRPEFYPPEALATSTLLGGNAASFKESNPTWDRIQKHINSDNPNDWRVAIIEADIVLGEILEGMGLPGETIGDKLKAVEKSDFNTIESAWEAHKARNAIAHEGNDYLLNEREAKRIVGLYQQVFEEFKFI